jgi:cyanophycinase
MDHIISRYYDEPNFVVAGTSAGAAAMPNTMIVSGSSQDAMMKGALQLTNGLGLIGHALIDTHFTQRGRFGRIIQTIIGNPGVIGLGLGEDTGIVIYKGDVMEVVGSGLVVIIDGSTINYTDLTEIGDFNPLQLKVLQCIC